LTFVSLARRVQEALGREGRWLVTVETPRNHWSEALQYTCYEAELKDNGRVKLIDDLESFSRELSLIDDCERCFGPGFGAD
jgi:hypothetical protein